MAAGGDLHLVARHGGGDGRDPRVHLLLQETGSDGVGRRSNCCHGDGFIII